LQLKVVPGSEENPIETPWLLVSAGGVFVRVGLSGAVASTVQVAIDGSLDVPDASVAMTESEWSPS
jgi:hypothetical protein